MGKDQGHSDCDKAALGFTNRLMFNLVHTVKLFTTQSQLLTILRKKPFGNIVGKGENAGNQHFLLFPQCFLTFPNKNLNFLLTFILSPENSFRQVQNFVVL